MPATTRNCLMLHQLCATSSKMMMKTIGIDPGAGGAIALLNDRQIVTVLDMPTVLVPSRTKSHRRRRIDAAGLAGALEALGPVDAAFVELAGPMPRDGSAGSFWFGKAAGVVEGCLAGLGFAGVTLVPPAVWKRRLNVPTPKDAARARASQLFGEEGAALWPLKKHDGRAEAAMIALFGFMDRACGKW